MLRQKCKSLKERHERKINAPEHQVYRAKAVEGINQAKTMSLQKLPGERQDIEKRARD
jgi:hypothetical protein